MKKGEEDREVKGRASKSQEDIKRTSKQVRRGWLEIQSKHRETVGEGGKEREGGQETTSKRGGGRERDKKRGGREKEKRCTERSWKGAK